MQRNADDKVEHGDFAVRSLCDRNVCLKILLGGLSAAKSTMHAWHFCPWHPSSIFMGIHFWTNSML